MAAIRSVQTLVRLNYTDGTTVTLQTPNLPPQVNETNPHKAVIMAMNSGHSRLVQQFHSLGIVGAMQQANLTNKRMQDRDRRGK
jgi:hypothetical protein